MDQAKILIVEDEAIIAMEIESSLQNLGYIVTSTVSNGQDAIEKTKTESPDLILMDIRIKGELDGIETAEIIRNEYSVPVVFSTAYLDHERIGRAKITMPFGYLLKPIQERDLAVTIEMALYVSKVDAERKQVEKALKDSEEKYKTAFKTSPDSVNINRLDGLYVNINEGFTRLTGYSEEDIIGKLSSDVEIWAIPADRERLIAGLEKQGYVENLQSRFRCKDGSFKIALMSARVIDLDGEPHILSITRDISDRIHLETKLQEKEKRLQQAHKIAKLGHWDWFMDSGELVWSDEVYWIFGQDLDTFIVTVESFEAIVHPDDLDDVVKERERGLTEKSDFNLEHRVIKASGEIVHVNEIAEIVRNEKDEVVHMRGVVQDITDRKVVEAELQQSQHWFSTTLHSIGDAVIATDADGLVTLLNPIAETLTGWVSREAVGKPLSEVFQIVNEKSRKTVENPVEKVIETGGVVGLANHTILMRRDGTEVPIDDSAAPIKNQSGEITGVVLVFHDITDKRKTEKALEESESLFKSLFENIEDGFALHEMIYDEQKIPSDYRFLDVNSAFEKLTGLSRQHIIGKTVTEVLPGTENDPADWIGTYGKVVMNNSPIEFEQYSEILQKWFSCKAFKTRENCFAVSFTDIS